MNLRRMGWRNWLRWLIWGYWIEEYANGFAVRTDRLPSEYMGRRMKAAFDRESQRRAKDKHG